MPEEEKQHLLSRVSSASGDVTKVSRMLVDLEGEIGEIDSTLASLPSRLISLRQRGYIYLKYLDTSLDSLSNNWEKVAPSIKESAKNLRGSLQPDAERLQAEIGNVEAGIRGASTDSISHYGQIIASLSSQAASLERRARTDTEHVEKSLGQFSRGLSSINRDVSIAENTLRLASQSSFRPRAGENPVLALRAKYLAGDKNEGVFFLTDQRFVFEGEKDIVLEKLWIIPTKKRKEKSVVAAAPIGSINEIAKGRVGLLEWTGVYVRFKPETGWAEMPFDVKGAEADTIVRIFNYISSGDADLDKTGIEKTASQIRASTPTVVRCPYCGAPYSREIYRGQVSLECEYCGSSISLK
ncbi:hypothetical protein ISS96_02440 [Candidatus Bathyarchaeota archaeon]|nr:hypothetical protein [Candidatus Bathyarchaeota archaeon]